MNLTRLRRFSRSCARAPWTVGIVPACQWMFSTVGYNLKIGGSKSLKMKPRFLQSPVKLRIRSSDPFIFQQIMIENEYLPLKNLFPPTILDLGANIGLASAWFLSRFPEARIFAVEADLENYNLCRENLAPYGARARVFHGAAWSRRKTLMLRRKTCAADHRVEEADSEDLAKECVEGWDVASLIAMSGFDRVHLVKIDIEGAEAEIFRKDSANWLSRVDNLCIELHGPSCRDALFQALGDYEYKHMQSGELDFCTGLRQLSIPIPA